MAKWEERIIMYPSDGWMSVDFIFKHTAYSIDPDRFGRGKMKWCMCSITKQYPYEEFGDSWMNIAENHVPRCLLKRARELMPVLLIANAHLVENYQ